MQGFLFRVQIPGFEVESSILKPKEMVLMKVVQFPGKKNEPLSYLMIRRSVAMPSGQMQFRCDLRFDGFVPHFLCQALWRSLGLTLNYFLKNIFLVLELAWVLVLGCTTDNI